MTVSDKNLRLYLHSCENQDDDQNGSKIFNHTFDSSLTFSKVFDYVVSEDKISIFPLKKDPIFVVHTKSNDPQGQLPNLSELFLSKFVTRYQQYRKRTSSVKISFVTIDTTNHFSTSNNIVDRLNLQNLESIHDASVVKCESVGLMLAMLAESNYSFNSTSMSCTSIMSFKFKDNFTAYFVHTHVAHNISTPSCWEDTVEWEAEALQILELKGVLEVKDLNFWFIMPGFLRLLAVDCKKFYSSGGSERPTLENHASKNSDHLQQETDELEQNLTQIRSDLNLISNFLVNNSVRMAQELDYQSDVIDEQKLTDMERELEILQGKLASLVGENQEESAASDEAKKKIEWFFQAQQGGVMPSIDNKAMSQVQTRVDKPRIFLHVRPMNALEKSKRSRYCVKINTNEDDTDRPHSLRIDDPVEGEYNFNFCSGIYESKEDMERLINPELLDDIATGDSVFSNTNFWILGSQNSRAESIILGSDYSTLIEDKGQEKEISTDSLLGKICQLHLPIAGFSVSYLCFTDNRVLDLFESSNEIAVVQQTPFGISHNGSKIEVQKDDLWKLILYAHGVLDINLSAAQKSRCTLLLQFTCSDGRFINIIKVGIGHTHALLTNITGKAEGGVGGVLNGLLQRAKHRCCLCISPSSFGLTETIYWLNLTKVIEKVQIQGQPSDTKKNLVIPDQSKGAKREAAIQLHIQSEALTNLQVENLELIQTKNKLEHDYAILAFRHKHTLQTLHTMLKLYHTLSSNITHYACKDIMSVMQRTPGVAPVVDLIKLGEIEGMMSKVGLDIDEGSNWMMPTPTVSSAKDEDKGLLVHDVEVPEVELTRESLEKSGMAMVEASKDDIPDIHDVQAWAGDLKRDPTTDLEKLARMHIDLHVKYSDLNRSCGDMFESVSNHNGGDGNSREKRLVQKPKSRLQLSKELMELRKEKDLRSNDTKKLLRSLVEAGVTIKSQSAKLVDQRNHLQHMEEQYSHLQTIFTKMVTDFHANEKKYQENVTHLTQLLNAITLGGNYYGSGEILSQSLDNTNIVINDDNSENIPPIDSNGE